MRDPIACATVVIAIATVVYAIATIFLWQATKEQAALERSTFEAAYRPRVAVDGIATANDGKSLNITPSIKTFGQVPAERFDVDWELSLNNLLLPSTKIPSQLSTLQPGQSTLLHAAFAGPPLQRIMAGEPLVVVIRASYHGPNDKPYAYCVKEQYDPLRNAFLNLGAC